MIQFTNEASQSSATDCEFLAVFMIDRYDENRDLLDEEISINEDLESCGYGPEKCKILLNSINKNRSRTNRSWISASKITPATKIAEVIGYVC